MGKKKATVKKSTLSTVRVIGDTKLIRGCREAILHLRETEDPSTRAAKLVVQRAKQLAPKRSGALARSITHDQKGRVFSPLPYAEVIHWGWPARNIKANWYILNAAREMEYTWLNYFEEFTEEAVDKMARGK